MNKLLLTFSLFIWVSCNNSTEYQKAKEDFITDNSPISSEAKPSNIKNGTGELIPIDATDNQYFDVFPYSRDTITKEGWRIQYFVKDDSTRYSDLYIQWSKGSFQNVYHYPSVLEFRSYFIPEFVSETSSHLLLEHGCATGCWAVLALAKDKSLPSKDYNNLIDSDNELGLLVHLSDETYEEEQYVLSVIDLKKGKEHDIRFNHICSDSRQVNCIREVVFKPQKVTVKVELRENYQATAPSLYSKTVVLD